jgi:hypothetical protein
MTSLIPFGKKKGLPADDLLNDPKYLNWLQANAAEYTRQKYPDFYPVLMNSGRRATETPEHNRLQVLFLDEAYQQSFCRVAKPGWEDRIWSEFVAEVTCAAQAASPERKDALNQLPALCWLDTSSRAVFEIKGIDVGIRMNVSIGCPEKLEPAVQSLPYALRCPGNSEAFSLEIKRDVGDEYPTVLRQMLALKTRYLFLESYSGIGATTEQFIDIFHSSGKIVVWKDDVDAEYDRLMSSGEGSWTVH